MMKLNKVTTVTKKQAKAYTAIALHFLGASPNDININMVDGEIDEAMKLYTPNEAVEVANRILQDDKTVWQKINAM